MASKLKPNQILIIFILLAIIYYTLFLKCFFPVKLSREGLANKSSLPLAISTGNGYDHIVLVIIDAMRSDFIHDVDTHMIFTRNIIRSGHGLNFTAKVNPPTVTLPRIKALTTGGIPGFVDVVLNFGSGELMEDNIITQLKFSGQKVVFYGDNTWLRLFPQQFTRQEGTTSFFVTDYTEVDNNVTRHLSAELEEPDWRFMVLHYLGLDHIGHIAGPYSPLIKPKLQEMDNVIKQIYSQMEIWERNEGKSLLVVCGDHGMSDQGGHGGATPGETNVPVLFLSPSFKYRNKETEESEILQIDLAATLATLLSVPIPLNNLGTVIIDSLVDYSTGEKVDILYYNAQQVAHLLKYSLSNYDKNQGFILFNQTAKRHKGWLESSEVLSPPAHDNIGKSLIRNYKKATQLMREQILETSTVYDIHGMVVAIVFLWMIVISSFLRMTRTDSGYESSSKNYSISMLCIGGGVFCHVTICTSQYGSQTLCSFNLASVFLQLIGLISFIWLIFQLCCMTFSEARKHRIKRFKPTNIVEWWLLTGTVLHTLSLLSSSFVEEEHQTWYFYVVTLYLLLMWHSFLEQREIQKVLNSSKNTQVVQEYMSTKENETFNDNILATGCVSSNFKDKEKERLILVFPKGFVKCVSAITVVLIILRLCRCWNQTGNKWLDIPDFGDWLVRPENKDMLSILTGVSLIAILILQVDSSVHNNIILAGCFLSTYYYRVSTSSLSSPFTYRQSKGISEARISFLCTGLLGMDLIFHTLKNKRYRKLSSAVLACKKLQRVWISVMVLVLRPHNISLVALYVLSEKLTYYCVVHYFKLTVPFLTLFCYWMGQAAYFYQGNSNSLTTIDVSSGYIGLEDYQPVIIGVLMFLSTYCGVIFWILALIKYLFSLKLHTEGLVLASETLVITKCLPLAVYTVLVTLQRYHLFVWTVFSPKVLYEGGLLLLVSCLVLILLAMSRWKGSDTESKSE